MQLVAGDARTDGCVAADHVGGAGEGIDAEVDVTQRAQLSLEQNLLALAVGLVQESARIADVILEQLGVLLAPGPHLFQIDRLLAVDLFHGQVLPLHDGGQTVLHGLVQVE